MGRRVSAGIFGSIGNLSQLGILLDQRGRSQHSLPADHGLQLQRVHSRFAFEVIVGDYVRRCARSATLAILSFQPASSC